MKIYICRIKDELKVNVKTQIVRSKDTDAMV